VAKFEFTNPTARRQARRAKSAVLDHYARLAACRFAPGVYAGIEWPALLIAGHPVRHLMTAT